MMSPTTTTATDVNDIIVKIIEGITNNNNDNNDNTAINDTNVNVNALDINYHATTNSITVNVAVDDDNNKKIMHPSISIIHTKLPWVQIQLNNINTITPTNTDLVLMWYLYRLVYRAKNEKKLCC